MTKTAIFVEGQTELIFVRELLLKVFEYQNISLECFTLFTDVNFHATEYAFPNEHADHYFQIINVGSDQSVLTRILKREPQMKNAGFERIIGLRDMYSGEYRNLVKNQKIDDKINQKFIEGHRSQIKSDNIFFSFAIMEIETWLLGLRKSFERMDNRLTPAFIHQHLGFDLNVDDPENIFFHPADNVEEIFKLVGQKYSKSKGDINALVSHIEKDDYLELLGSDKCQSFKEFYEYLQIPTT
ncbi:protein of unknown function [Chitinophaga sp. YR573]|uniref:DUF4276 family protein n=1 Tax=Chitinophaga sp. YR573 TaxID=1881040 RepID=UPI0008CE96B4|nr:DUF4276 family protein [Chitinophaga sp. YR573]SEW40281.1 protein of unknown function [Chitinophaga sp. YR573]